jgi:hypothetical protein
VQNRSFPLLSSSTGEKGKILKENDKYNRIKFDLPSYRELVEPFPLCIIKFKVKIS